MRIAYFDVFAGISGDMTLGALVDAGVPVEALRAELEKIHMHGWKLEAEKTAKAGIAGTLVRVEAGCGHGHGDALTPDPSPGGRGEHDHGRPCSELVALIEESHLDPDVIRKSVELLWRVAEAEATVHGTTKEEVHFHELGGLDSIVDIVGAVVGLKMLGVEEIVCSPLPVSHGFIDCAHGRLPVPAPATAELLKGVPTFPLDVDGETVTPTGAVLAVGLADRFGYMPAMTVETIAHGLGRKDFPGVPNVLRLIIGERTGTMPGVEGGEGSWDALITDRVRLIEANIDDMSPELYSRVMERAFAAGAVDVWLTPIQMKKGRPGTQLSALAAPDAVEAVATAILEESTTFGVRISDWERRCLPRERVTVETPYGPIRVKVGKLGGKVVSASPEYEDCAEAATRAGVALKQVYAAAVSAWHVMNDE